MLMSMFILMLNVKLDVNYKSNGKAMANYNAIDTVDVNANGNVYATAIANVKGIYVNANVNFNINT